MVEDPGPRSLKSIPYSKYAVVGRPLGFTEPDKPAPLGPLTTGAPGLTPGAPEATANVAVTAVSASMTTWQGAVPEQPPPLQPENAEPNAGVAVSVTT